MRSAIYCYRVRRLVGGVGVYVVRTSGPQAGEPDVAAGEYAAIQGASGSGAVIVWLLSSGQKCGRTRC